MLHITRTVSLVVSPALVKLAPMMVMMDRPLWPSQLLTLGAMALPLTAAEEL